MRFPFRRRSSAAEKLKGASWRCASCGGVHQGMFDLGVPAPDFWDKPEEPEPNGALRMDGDFLSDDFCVVGGENFFVRCVFEIPVREVGERFGFGVWSTLSRTNFNLYVERFDEGDEQGLGPWTGWFANRLATFADTLNQPCWVHPQRDRQRPLISLMDEDHPLSIAARDGISAERVMEIYAAYGHEPA